MNDAGTATFEAERQALTALAYRMLGERAEAEDVVQETWLRWSHTDQSTIRNAPAWLRRTAARIAIDVLRSARKRREVYVGPWLPEPLVEPESRAPGDAFELAQECELALLWAMERLNETERAAFILREVFDADYASIAETLGKTQAACRQLVSRAGRRVRENAPRFKAPADETADLLTRFLQAASARDQKAVMALLSPDVIAVSDGGGKASAALRPLRGREEVTQVALRVAERRATNAIFRPGRANGSPAAMILEGGPDDVLTVIAPDAQGHIAWIYSMRNPDKLHHCRSV